MEYVSPVSSFPCCSADTSFTVKVASVGIVRKPALFFLMQNVLFFPNEGGQISDEKILPNAKFRKVEL